MDVFDVLREKLNKKKEYFQKFYEVEGRTEADEYLNKATQLAFDDAVEIVNQVEETYNENDNTDHAVNELYAFWEKWHGKVENNDWIPCSESFPDKSLVICDVLYNDDLGNGFHEIKILRYEGDGKFYNSWNDKQNVIAWQPLPEPYRGEDYSRIQTNADRIHAMGDEGLAELFFALGVDDCEKIPFCQNSTRCEEIADKGEPVPHELCKQCMVDWLKKEVEE